jgi:phospholipase C
MPSALSTIDTIILVMLENRSFDHLLGYLSLPPYARPNLEGLKPGLLNSFNGADYPVFHLANPDEKLPDDPPHEREDIAVQLTGLPGAIRTPPPYPMIGFVESYYSVHDIDAGDQPEVMGYYTGTDLPTTHFLAQNFAVCDHWFASIPTGTQPNRLMAMSGYTQIDRNQSVLLPKQKLVYDWLTEKNVSWRVYHQGIPFFMMMDDWHLKVLSDPRFKDYDDFQADWVAESGPGAAQVIFIEPRYTDAPHFELPADDHPPTPVSAGQQFLMRVYSDLMTNPLRWARTVMIVTYDEHGGFFDHLSPVAIRTEPPSANLYVPFESTGPRVPALVVSPLVEPKAVDNGIFDHTSFLKLLGRQFGGGSYSAEVDARGVGDLTDVLTRTEPRTDIPLPPPPSSAGFTPNQIIDEPIPQAFRDAVQKATAQNQVAARAKFPELFSHFNAGPKPGR